MAIVYQHRRKDTNEIFYIGIGKHKNRAYQWGRNDYWNNIATNIGYEVDVLIDGCSYEEAKSIEIGLIESIGSIWSGGTLVNMTKGGDHNPMENPEVVKKVMISQKPIKSKQWKENNPMFKEKNRQKHSDMKKGINNPMAKTVSQYSLNDEYIKTFDTIREASKILNINRHGIGQTVLGKQKTAGGYKWKHN